jgi:hypothetical protein
MLASFQVPTTTWEMSILSVPGKAATRNQRIAFFHNQLDRIAAAASKGNAVDILGGLRLSGCGPRDRLEGGTHIMSRPQNAPCVWLHVYPDLDDVAIDLQTQYLQEQLLAETLFWALFVHHNRCSLFQGILFDDIDLLVFSFSVRGCHILYKLHSFVVGGVAGQAIVQMVHNPSSRLEYAAKFFIAHDAFERERALYHGKNPLGKFLPQVMSPQTISIHVRMPNSMQRNTWVCSQSYAVQRSPFRCQHEDDTKAAMHGTSVGVCLDYELKGSSSSQRLAGEEHCG